VSRNIAGNAALEIAKKQGTDPLLIVEVDWPPTISYATRTAFGIPGKVMSVSTVDATAMLADAGKGGSSAAMTVTLDDSDESIRTLFNTKDVHLRPARVYQAYGDLTLADRFLLFSGVVTSPLTWDERQRTFTFDILGKIEERQIGFAPEQGEFDFIAESAVGRAWPLCFGSPIRVPAVKITDAIRGTSLTKHGMVSYGDLLSLCSAAGQLADAEDAKTRADADNTVSDTDYADVIDSLSAARINFDNLLSDLIKDAPSSGAALKLYADNCMNLRREEVERDYNVSRIRELQAGLDSINLAVASAEAQIYDIEQKMERHLEDFASPDAKLMTQYEDAILQLERTIDGYEASDMETYNCEHKPPLPGCVRDMVGLLDGYDLALAQKVDATNDWMVNLSNIALYEEIKENYENDLIPFSLTEFAVDGGEEFPQGSTVTVKVNNLRMSGTFNDRVFTVESVLPNYSDLPVAFVEDKYNEFTVEEGVDLRQLFCWIANVGLIYIDEQDGTTCRFTPLLFTRTGVNVSYFMLNGEEADREIYDFTTFSVITQVCPIVLQPWIQNLASLEPFACGINHAKSYDWSLDIGSEVVLDTGEEDIYVANLIPSTAVHEVMGRRSVDGVDQIVPIPSQYYTVTLDEEIAGQHATTIRFIRPLTSFQDQRWTGEVFVSLTSSQGPNTASIIQYLIQTYTTGLSVDATTFTAVQTALANYPSHFALLTQTDALTTIQEIAWQARCAAYVRNSVVYLKYLATEEAAVQTLTESDLRDLIVSFTPSEDLVTRFTALWRKDLSINEPNKVVLRNNVPKYGLLEREYDFFIYNIQDLVLKSATFWLIRLSNTWKRLSFTSWLNSLNLEEHDAVNLNITGDLFSTGAIKGVVQSSKYDPSSRRITYEIELPVRIGEMTQYLFYWPADADAGDEYPTELDLYAGGG
jgi:hypothetical protein